MVRILVTGSAGFIGSHFADYAIEQGDQVIGIDNLSYGKIENVNAKEEFIKADLRDYKTIEKIILSQQPQKIVHFAANTATKTSAMGWDDPMLDYSINMVGTLNILEIIRRDHLDIHLIYASTAAIYGEPKYLPIDEEHPPRPISPYGISKLTGERYCYAYNKEWGVKATIMRIFNSFGSRQRRYVMHDQIKNMLANPEEIQVLGTGDEVRDYVYILDTVKAFYLAMTNPHAIGETFNVAAGNKVSIRELIKLIKSILNISKEEIYTGRSWKGDIARLWADTKRIKKILDWRPKISLGDGVKRLVDWIKTYEKI